MGTSDSVLQRGANRSKRAIQQLQRKLTPNRRMRAESNGVAKRVNSTSLKPSTSNDIDYRRDSNNELRQLLMEEDDSYQVCCFLQKNVSLRNNSCLFAARSFSFEPLLFLNRHTTVPLFEPEFQKKKAAICERNDL